MEESKSFTLPDTTNDDGAADGGFEQKFVRGMGLPMKCRPVVKDVCKVFTIGGEKERYCVKKSQMECISLDK